MRLLAAMVVSLAFTLLSMYLSNLLHIHPLIAILILCPVCFYVGIKAADYE